MALSTLKLVEAVMRRPPTAMPPAANLLLNALSAALGGFSCGRPWATYHVTLTLPASTLSTTTRTALTPICAACGRRKGCGRERKRGVKPAACVHTFHAHEALF